MQAGVRLPLKPPLTADCVQPSDVCSVVEPRDLLFTDSMISISPFCGQLPEEASIQNAGHTPQPVGMCATSTTTKMAPLPSDERVLGSKTSFEVTRTERRGELPSPVWSTRMKTWPPELTPASPEAMASLLLT